jgi:hypothetical protein
MRRSMADYCAAAYKTIESAGVALQQTGVIPPEVDVKAATAALIEPAFVGKLRIK